MNSPPSPGLSGAPDPLPIADYALLGDCQSAALVGKSGSIDWLCWPRFDSPACFAALLGTSEHGRWLIAPDLPIRATTRAYRPETMVLETLFTTDQGTVVLIDFMVPGGSSVVRIVEGRTGTVPMTCELVLRFDYGATIPWVTRLAAGDGLHAVAGPDQVVLQADTPMHGEGMTSVARFTARPGARVRFVLTHAAAHAAQPVPPDADAALAEVEAFWRDWSSRGTYRGPWRAMVERSLLTLKALSHTETGGIIAAPTTSLPEWPGGERNWDYRFCWLRDASLTLRALMRAGHREEATAWGGWLRRVIAGAPAQMHTLYGLAGERAFGERTIPWLPGYGGARPVRVGNGAADQLQLDIFGELMEALFQEARTGLFPPGQSWPLQVALIEHLETVWHRPDEGIWEVRGGQQLFTFSKVMAWVAVDRALHGAAAFGLPAPLERWRALRSTIHDDVLRHGFNRAKGCFTQVYGGDALDASLLLLPLVGFLPAHDPRITDTVAAIERELMVDGLVLRYRSADGLPNGEGVFLACSFWFVDNLILQGRKADAHAMFSRLVALANDVGLMAEEYDPINHRMLGNFPQAFSHLALVNTALNLESRAR